MITEEDNLKGHEHRTFKLQEPMHVHSSTMVSSSINCKILPAMILVFFLHTSSSVSTVFYSKPDFQQSNQTFRLMKELHKLKMIRAHLIKINKPSVKTIQACLSWLQHCKCSEFYDIFFFTFTYPFMWMQSPDGDLIDCVPSHLQPAFDHPHLEGRQASAHIAKIVLINSYLVV